MEDSTTNDNPPLTQVPAPAQEPVQAPVQKFVTFEQFAEMELRVALIEAAEAVPKSKKLIKLQVSLGDALGRRQILAGIAQYTAPEALVGKKIVIVANLQPAKLMGLESQGMLLAVQNSDESRVEVIQPPEGFEPGARVR